jgi:hypothetical protein
MLFLEASMSEPGPTAMPFIGSDRRSEILDRLASRARATPPATTPQAIAARVAASIQNQKKEPPRGADEGEGAKYAKYPDKDRKDMLDGRRPNKDEKDDKDDKDKEASDKDKETSDKDDDKDEKDNKDNEKDKEASDKDKELGKDDKDEKDIKDGQDSKGTKDGKDNKDEYDAGKTDDKDNGDKGDDETGTGTFTAEADELVDPDPASHGQPGETSASKPPAGGTGRPTSLLTRLPVV